MIRLFAIFRHCRKANFFKVCFVGEFEDGRDTRCTVLMLSVEFNQLNLNDARRMIELQTGARQVIILTHYPL